MCEILARNLYDVGFKYTYKIDDYLKGIDNGEDLDSPTFSINVNGLETLWSIGLRYWTNEDGLRLTNPVVICLNLVASSCTGAEAAALEPHLTSGQLHVKYQFGIWNNEGKIYEVAPVGSNAVRPATSSLQSVGTREIMILDRHLRGKSIEIFCKIMIIPAELEKHSLAQDLWGKYRNGEGCDVVIRSNDGKLVPAHSQILYARSSSFLEAASKEEEGGGGTIIPLPCNSLTLSSLLQYIYTDRVEPLVEPQQLLKLAVNLGLPGLKGICEKGLIDTIAPNTVASLLLIADSYGCEGLKKAALSFCGENPNSITKTISWKVMESLNPLLYEEVCEQL